MNRLSRYLFTQLLVSVLFSMLAITIVVWFSQSIRMLALVINSGGSVWAFMKLMLLVLPTFLPLILPLSLVVGCLFVYHRLTTENELQVMRATGLSPVQMAHPALLLSVIVAFVGYLMTVWIAPQANHELVRAKYEIANDYSLLLLRTGSFHGIQEGLSFYARSRGKDGELRGILIHDTRRAGRPTTIMAESGEMIRTEKGPNVLVKNGMRQELEAASGQLSQLSFKSYLVDLTTVNDGFSERWREPRERSMLELINPLGSDSEQVTVGRFLAEFHLRLTMPFLAITFTLIACTLMLTGFYNRDGMTRKIVFAAILVVGLEAGMLSAINLISKQSWMIVLLYLITLGPVPFLWGFLSGKRYPPFVESKEGSA
jgi:lipopolysaccharide export system permease protein